MYQDIIVAIIGVLTIVVIIYKIINKNRHGYCNDCSVKKYCDKKNEKRCYNRVKK